MLSSFYSSLKITTVGEYRPIYLSIYPYIYKCSQQCGKTDTFCVWRSIVIPLCWIPVWFLSNLTLKLNGNSVKHTKNIWWCHGSLHSLQGLCNSPQNLFLLIVEHSFWYVTSAMTVPGWPSVFNVLESTTPLQDWEVLLFLFPKCSSGAWGG